MGEETRRICTVDRDALRAWIPDRYRPERHVLGIFGGGLLVAAAILAAHLHVIRALDLVTFPLVFAFGSLAEYVAHRWIMHRRLSWLSLAWEAHTGRHHHYYRSDAPTWERPEDIWLLLFSPKDVAVLAAILVLPAVALRLFVPAGTWACGVAAAVLYFLFYEAVHLACHFSPEHPIARMPRVATLRARHLRHHHLEDMHANYGVTGSFWDRVLGTER